MKIFALSFFTFTLAAMAQVKVSDLPAASTLGGTEVFPTVQSATTKKATAAQIAEYARSVAAATLAPIASPTFTGTVTIPAGASIDGFLTTAAASAAYQPLATPLTNLAGLAAAAGVLTNNGSNTLSYTGTSLGNNGAGDDGKIVVFGSTGQISSRNFVRVYASDGTTYSGITTGGMSTNKNGQFMSLNWPATVTSSRVITLPDSTGTVALVSGALGTPSSVTLTNATGLPISTGISGLGTGIATALAVNVGSAGSPVINGGALGTPSSGTGTNITGIPPANITGTAAVLGANTFTGNQTAPRFISDQTSTRPQFTISSATTNGFGIAGDRVEVYIAGAVVANFLSGEWQPGSSAINWGSNTRLYGGTDGTGRLVLRNGTSAQQFSVARTYNSFTDKEEVQLGASGTLFHLWTIKGSSAGTARDLVLGTDSTERVRLSPSGFTIGASGTPIAAILSAVATKDFDLTAVTIEDQTMSVTGAAVGDSVQLGVPHGSVTTTASFTAWVSAADTVTIRCKTQATGENPASGSFRATVTKH